MLTKGSKDQDKEQQREQEERHVADVQNAASEVKEMLEVVLECDPGNPIHSAKLTRMGELHNKRAQAFTVKMMQEVKKAKRQANDCKTNGMKNISKALGGHQARPLKCVFRDKDTADEGQARRDYL